MRKCLPIIDDMNEVEMLKNTQYFTSKGYKPISITLRAFNQEMGMSEIIDEKTLPLETGKLFANRKITTRKIVLIDTYGKKINLNAENSNSLDELREWWIEKFPSSDGWNNRIEDITFECTRNPHKGVLISFERGESTAENGNHSLRLELIKELDEKWKPEKKFTERQLKEFAKRIATDTCTLDYTPQVKRKAKCS